MPRPEGQLRLGTAPSCWEPLEEQTLDVLLYHPSACRQPAELQDSLSGLLGFINSSPESAAKIGVGQLSADRAATRNQHLQRALLKEPSSLWKHSVGELTVNEGKLMRIAA